MAQGWFTEPLWFAPWAMVLVFLGCACEPGSLWGLGYFPNSFFPPLFFSSPLTDKQAEEGSEKPVLLKRPVFVLVSGICLYFTLTIANLEFNARRKRQSPDLLIYMFLTYLPLKSVVGGRETPEKDRLNWQIHLGVKIFKKKKKRLGTHNLMWLRQATTFEGQKWQKYHLPCLFSPCTKTCPVCLAEIREHLGYYTH